MKTRTTVQPLASDPPKRLHSAPWLGWLLPIGFGFLAVVLYAGSQSVEIPLAPANAVDRAELVVGPRRTAMPDPAHIMVNGAQQNCNGCHQIFKSGSASGKDLSFHEDVRLAHGMNNRCVNCHDEQNRERLTLRDGASVSFAETPQLCAQCHGTVYRDWQRGTHGKTLGSWMTNSDKQRRLGCNECHNPHSPRYEPYQPLPGPNTLRMGEQSTVPQHGETGKQSPLLRWLRDHDAAHPDHPVRDGGHR